MADIFISYAREDRTTAERLAKALEDQGWSVWWDPQIPAGKTFDDVIEQALEAAKSVVVLWSKHSVNSRWVRTEAAEGADRGMLVPVLIEEVRIPLAFKRIQAANMVEWDGTKSHPAFQKLVSDIAGILGLPPAAVAEEQRKAAEQVERKQQQEAERLKAKEEAAKREAAMDAKRKADEEKAKKAKEDVIRKAEAEAEKRRRAEQEAQREAEQARQLEKEAAIHEAEEAPASRIPEPTHPTVPPAAPRLSLKMITVLGGGIVVVAIWFAMLNMSEREPLRQPCDPGAEAPAKTAEPSKLMPLSPEMVEIPETAPGELPDTLERPGAVEAPVQPSIKTTPSDLPLSRSQWAEVQTALNDIGFDAGAIDGIPGSKTRSAIALFQESRDFPTSGRLTEAQWEKLLSDAPEAAQGRLGTAPASATDSAIRPEMVEIPAGCFQMGSPQGEGEDDERPQHRVCVNAFAIGKYEVTFDEYDRFAQVTGREKPHDRGWGRGRRPVINVSWKDATAYVKWLSEQTGKHYRLPSEAEWEYAARAGTDTPFFWGESPEEADSNAWYRENAHSMTHPVGKKEANPRGLYDTAGNVWEWVQDCWYGNYKSAPDDGSAWESRECNSRVLRGGAWDNDPQFVRSATRNVGAPAHRYLFLGFRLARTL